MRARPTRTVAITTTPVNIRKAVVPGVYDPDCLPVTKSVLRYASGGGTIEMVNGNPFARGSLTFVTNPVATETIAVNGVTFTFIAGASTTTDVHIGATKEETAKNLVDVLNASASGSVNVATYSVPYGGNIVTITYDTAGAGGNAFTLANSSGTVAVTRSAATLLGGQDFGEGTTVVAAVNYDDLDQGLERYAVASAGSIDLLVTDFGA